MQILFSVFSPEAFKFSKVHENDAKPDRISLARGQDFVKLKALALNFRSLLFYC